MIIPKNHEMLDMVKGPGACYLIVLSAEYYDCCGSNGRRIPTRVKIFALNMARGVRIDQLNSVPQFAELALF